MKAKIEKIADNFLLLINQAIGNYEREINSNKSKFLLNLKELYVENNPSVKLYNSAVIEIRDDTR